MSLNRYGLAALDFCRRHRPDAWVSITDPARHFEAIGEEIQAEVTRLRDQLLGPSRADGHPLELQRRASQALATAEELTLDDHPAFQPEPATNAELDETNDKELSAYRQALAAVNQAIHDNGSP